MIDRFMKALGFTYHIDENVKTHFLSFCYTEVVVMGLLYDE